MTESCDCPPEAGNTVCELPARGIQRSARAGNACPECGQIGKPVQGQTVKAMISVTLRRVQSIKYLFCKTQTCPVVYFYNDGDLTFSVEEVREQVYQKEPKAEEVSVCYCFRHTVGELRNASPQSRIDIVNNINTGINAGQCACDLRNPQGSCCLGNVRSMIKHLENPTTITT
jgi:hypothetical protein